MSISLHISFVLVASLLHIGNGRPLQCSPIMDRHRGYQNMRLTLVWYLGDRGCSRQTACPGSTAIFFITRALILDAARTQLSKIRGHVRPLVCCDFDIVDQICTFCFLSTGLRVLILGQFTTHNQPDPSVKVHEMYSRLASYDTLLHILVQGCWDYNKNSPRRSARLCNGSRKALDVSGRIKVNQNSPKCFIFALIWVMYTTVIYNLSCLQRYLAPPRPFGS